MESFSNETNAVFLACLLSAHSALAEDISCRSLEHAGIEDMETAELVETYCRYDALWKNHNDTRARRNQLFLEQIKTTQSTARIESLHSSYQRNDAKQTADQDGCSNQREKIAGVLKARGARVDLSCSSPSSATPKP